MALGTFIIAEAGVNHNGSEEIALKLVQAAFDAGANAVKFQTFNTEKLVSRSAVTAAYQKQNTGEDDQFSMLRRLELSEDSHRVLQRKCQQLGIEFMSTPFDVDAARFLIGLGMQTLKVPSGELTNLPFIRELSRFDRRMIMSTGMASLDEVGEAVETVRIARREFGYSDSIEQKLTLLHCTSNYPASFEDVNLRAMKTMADRFNLAVGYSDHTEGTLVAGCAVALGASVIEKHFTLDRNMPGPDHRASLEPAELAVLVRQVREIEESMGDGIKTPRDNELEIRDLVRRSVTLACAREAGDILREEDLLLLRPGTGIAPREFWKVIGKRMKHAKPAGATLDWQDLD